MPIIDDILAGTSGYLEGRAIADVRSIRNIELQRMQMEFDAMSDEQKARVREAARRRAREQARRQSRNGIIFLAIVAIVMVLIAIGSSKGHAGETPMYDKDGRYQGSVFDYARTQTYTDRNGQFNGSAVNNGNGTTSFFNRNGQFSGSAGSSIDRAFNFNKR
jgi:hypothetical protein